MTNLKSGLSSETEEYFDSLSKGIDENYKVGEVEDIDFCLRAITCGFKIGITPKEVAEHQAHVSLNKFSEIAKKKGMTDFKYFQDGNRRYFKQKWNGTKWENLLNY